MININFLFKFKNLDLSKAFSFNKHYYRIFVETFFSFSRLPECFFFFERVTKQTRFLWIDMIKDHLADEYPVILQNPNGYASKLLFEKFNDMA